MKHLSRANRLIGWGIVAVLALFFGALFEGCSKAPSKSKFSSPDGVFSAPGNMPSTGVVYSTGNITVSGLNQITRPLGFFIGNVTIQCRTGGWVVFFKDGIVCKYPSKKKRKAFSSRLPRDQWEPVSPDANWSFNGAVYYKSFEECEQARKFSGDVCEFVEWHITRHVTY